MTQRRPPLSTTSLRCTPDPGPDGGLRVSGLGFGLRGNLRGGLRMFRGLGIKALGIRG